MEQERTGTAPRADVVANADYWNTPLTVESQQRSHPFLNWYEDWMVAEVARALGDAGRVARIHVIGCGSGREVPMLRAVFPRATIVASDVASGMVEICAANLRRWGCEANVELRCADAAALRDEGAPADAVLIPDNVLNYVTPAEARARTLRALHALLRPGGVVAGTVHNRWGRVTKSGFFALRAGASLVRRPPWDAGDRIARLHAMPVRVHYFTAAELRGLLGDASFVPLHLLSLGALARRIGRRYDVLRGDNNLVFVAARGAA